MAAAPDAGQEPEPSFVEIKLEPLTATPVPLAEAPAEPPSSTDASQPSDTIEPVAATPSTLDHALDEELSEHRPGTPMHLMEREVLLIDAELVWADDGKPAAGNVQPLPAGMPPETVPAVEPTTVEASPSTPEAESDLRSQNHDSVEPAIPELMPSEPQPVELRPAVAEAAVAAAAEIRLTEMELATWSAPETLPAASTWESEIVAEPAPEPAAVKPAPEPAAVKPAPEFEPVVVTAPEPRLAAAPESDAAITPVPEAAIAPMPETEAGPAIEHAAPAATVAIQVDDDLQTLSEPFPALPEAASKDSAPAEPPPAPAPDAPPERDVSNAWETAIRTPPAVPDRGARPVPSMWEHPAREHAHREEGPADFLLEPLPPNDMPFQATAVTDVEPGAQAEIEHELFAEPPKADPQGSPPTARTAIASAVEAVAAALAEPNAPAVAASPVAPAPPATSPMPRPAADDPLAALTAMTDEERIALFT